MAIKCEVHSIGAPDDYNVVTIIVRYLNKRSLILRFVANLMSDMCLEEDYAVAFHNLVVPQ